MNPKYQKGIRFERELVNKAKKQGKIAYRSAGSHSAIDLCIIDVKKRVVRFIQAKKGKSHISKQDIQKFEDMSDEYLVKFEVISK